MLHARYVGDNIEKYLAHNKTWLDGMAMLRSAGSKLQHYFHTRNLTCGGEKTLGLTRARDWRDKRQVKKSNLA